MPSSPADHAYDHALAVLRQPDAAGRAAAGALARGGRSLPSLLDQTRQLALAEAGAVEIGVPAGVPTDLVQLAWWLTASRPAEERAVVDLDARHGLNRAGLGRALAMAPARAVAEAAEVDRLWELALGPGILAWLGPGGCTGLHQLLAGSGLGPAPVEADPDVDEAPPVEDWPAASAVDVLAVAPAVAAHLAVCDLCADRRRSIPTVRSLLAQVPIAAAPAEVVNAARTGRRLPLPMTARPGRPRPRRLAAVIAAAIAVAVAASAVVLSRSDGRSGSPVAALTRIPAANALTVVPAAVRPGETFQLRNRSGKAVRWHATTGVAWAVAVPAAGRLAAHSSQPVRIRLSDDAPEGALTVDVGVAGDDGSATVAHLEGSVEHPPTVAATRQGCTVAATVEDEGQVTAVELRWSAAGGEAGRAMSPRDDGYVAALAPGAGITEWWVDAVDARGNRASTSHQSLAPADCAA